MTSDTPCLLCGGPRLRLCFECEEGGVTSDCKPWSEPVRTYACADCGHVQKRKDRTSADSVRAIYANYTLYHLSDGGEQLIFTASGPRTRSSLLFERLAAEFSLPATGRLLDVGCGAGGSLRAFGALLPRWEMAGFEQGDSGKERILSIPGVKHFWSGSLDTVPGPHDLATVVHVLEHVPTPATFLEQIRHLLAPGGRILIQVPDPLENPFDMLIGDHYSHFSMDVLTEYLRRCGFEILQASKWLPKELTVILGGRKVDPAPRQTPVADLSSSFARNAAWLKSVAAAAKEQARADRFGVFGTAIAGTWVGSIVRDRLGFFVEEDRQRVGKTHLGRPVVAPESLARGDRVYLAFPYPLAKKIHDRLAPLGPATYVLPPARSGE